MVDAVATLPAEAANGMMDERATAEPKTDKLNEVLEVGDDLVLSLFSAVPFVGSPLQGVFQALTNRRFRKQFAFLTQVTAELEGRIEWLEEALADPARADVVIGAIPLAERIPVESDSFRLLAQVVAFGIADPANASRAQMLLDVAGQLLPIHLEVLRQIGMSGHGTSRRDLVMRFGNDIDPLVARLDSVGLIHESGSQNQGPLVRTPSGQLKREVRPGIKTVWLQTPFGDELLRHLDAANKPGDVRGPTTTTRDGRTRRP